MNEKSIHITISKTIEDLIPKYLDNRFKDVIAINNALSKKDFSLIISLGHKLKGSGSGYGFEAISELGKALEASAKEKNSKDIKAANNALSQYLKNIHITFE